MDLDKIWDLDLASQRHHFCRVLSKSAMVGLNPHWVTWYGMTLNSTHSPAQLLPL